MGKSGTQVELLDLGGLDIAGWRGKDQPEDDFTPLLPKFREPALGGLTIGSPCYFRSMSSITKCFLERLAPLRKPEMVLADKPVGVISVGGFRNGRQELTIQQIHSVLLCYGMLPVGGRPPAFQGATLHSENDSISEDQLGLETATQLGKRIAAIPLLRTSSAKNTDHRAHDDLPSCPAPQVAVRTRDSPGWLCDRFRALSRSRLIP